MGKPLKAIAKVITKPLVAIGRAVGIIEKPRPAVAAPSMEPPAPPPVVPVAAPLTPAPPPPAPVAAPPPPTPDDPEADTEIKKAVQAVRQARGRRATLFGGYKGTGEPARELAGKAKPKRPRTLMS